jgi:uncharacterized membrane protein
MTDGRKRSLLKALSWRFVAVVITMVVSFIVTGEILVAASIGLLDSLIKIFAYYYHERAWNGTNFGVISKN